jgi:signal transduction histidine kinase
MVDESRHNSMIDVELTADELVGEPDAETTAHLLGIVSEALSNIARHSGATRADIHVATDVDGTLRLDIQDNGHGFDPSAVGTLGHQGLANIRSRVATVGGTMDIVSSDTGTNIVIRRPPDGLLAAEESTAS